MRGERHHRRAHHAAIDELVARQAPGIVAAFCRDPAAAQRHEIGGSAADIDQQCVARAARGERGRGVPVGRGDARGSADRLGGGEETAVMGIDGDAVGGHATRHHLEDGAHSGGAIGEEIGKLGGHRHRVPVGRRAERQRVVQRRGKPVEAEPQRRRHLASRHQHAVARECELEMGAADVPAENDGHRPVTAIGTERGARGRTRSARRRLRRASTSAAGLIPMLSARPI